MICLSLRNYKNLSAFGKRLVDLMGKDGSPDPIDLAKKLYEAKLVTVNSKKDQDIFKKHDNAIESIAKKIRKHINADDPSCLQGEFVIAYCKHFGCSSDYLLGFTDIQTPNINIQELCETTLLSEQAILNFSDDQDHEHHELVSSAWSFILESELFNIIPLTIIDIGTAALYIAQKEAELEATMWEKQFLSGRDLLDLNLDIEGDQQIIASKQREIDGLLSDISDKLANVIRSCVDVRISQIKPVLNEKFLEIAKSKHKL